LVRQHLVSSPQLQFQFKNLTSLITFSLELACQFNRYEVAKYLLEHGAKTNLDKDQPDTALHLAAAYGTLELVELLLSHGANMLAYNEDDEVPLHSATLAGKIDIIKLLVTKGTPVDIKSKDHPRSSLQRAVWHNLLQPAIVCIIHHNA